MNKDAEINKRIKERNKADAGFIFMRAKQLIEEQKNEKEKKDGRDED